MVMNKKVIGEGSFSILFGSIIQDSPAETEEHGLLPEITINRDPRNTNSC